MTGSSSKNRSSGSSRSSGSVGIITGTFAVVENVEHVLKTYEKAVTKAIKEVSKAEQARMQTLVSSSENDWQPIKKNLKVAYDYDSGEFIYSVNGGKGVQKLAMELEYGTPDRPPQPVLRSSALSGAQTLEAQLDEEIAKRLRKYR